MKNHKKSPNGLDLGYKLETTALISKWNYNVFRIRCIMLILAIFHNTAFVRLKLKYICSFCLFAKIKFTYM